VLQFAVGRREAANEKSPGITEAVSGVIRKNTPNPKYVVRLKPAYFALIDRSSSDMELAVIHVRAKT
jgi:hypothetical protein